MIGLESNLADVGAGFEVLGLESNLADVGAGFEALGVAVGGEAGEVVAFLAAEDGIDGGLATDVLDLSAAEVVGGGEGECIGIAEPGNHHLPDATTDGGVGLLEADFVEETALESAVEVLGEVGGGNHDAVEVLHLL